MVLGAELAGEAVVGGVPQVGRRVPRHVRAGVGAFGIMVPDGRFVRPAMMVPALGHQRGQDVEQG